MRKPLRLDEPSDTKCRNSWLLIDGITLGIVVPQYLPISGARCDPPFLCEYFNTKITHAICSQQQLLLNSYGLIFRFCVQLFTLEASIKTKS
jgi:hypothetical protein